MVSRGIVKIYIAGVNTAWVCVWSLESRIFAHVLSKELGIVWMISCDLVGYNFYGEVFNTLSWKEMLGISAGNNILKTCMFCTCTTVMMGSCKRPVPTKELIIIWMLFCDLVGYNSPREALYVSYREYTLDGISGTDILEI